MVETPMPSGSVPAEQIEPDPAPENELSAPDSEIEDEYNDTCYGKEPEEIPYITDDLIKKVEEYWKDPIHNKWPLPEYAYAGPP